MATQTFLWILLPNGTDGTTLKFSAFVAPRLDPQHLNGSAGTLADFTFSNWASLMQSLTMSVVADSHPAPIPAQAVPASPPLNPALDTALWNLIFPSQTPVLPFRFFDYSAAGGVEIVSYSILQIIIEIERIISSTVSLTVRDRKVPAFVNAIRQFRDVLEIIETTIIQFSQTTKVTTSETAVSRLLRIGVRLTPLQQALFDFERFYNRYRLFDPLTAPQVPFPGWTDRALFPPSSTSNTPATPADFHAIVALLADYPATLRALGLVRDFTISASILGSQTTGLRLVPSYPTPPGPAVTFNVTPTTMARINVGTRYFRAADRAGSVVQDAMLTLDNTAAFQVVQGQADGAISKTIDWGLNDFYRLNPKSARYVSINNVLTLQAAGQPTGMEPCAPADPTTTVPAYRSGVQVVENGRAAALEAQLVRQAQFNSAPASAVLFSDDLLRGYRVDVNDRGNWRQLCARTGTAQFTNGSSSETVTVAEEGYVKATTGTKKDEFPFELYVHESVFGWDGWSLVAPHPGLTTSDPGDPGYQQNVHQKAIANTNVVADGDAGATPHTFIFGVTTDMHAVPGTLPRLRFGNTYRFRARAVDLAGNSLPFVSVPTDHATQPFTYLRFEPVLSPALVATARFTAGESLEHLVIRDGVGSSARFVAPPKASQLEIETHGKLDTLLASPSTFQAAFNLSAKESGTFTDQAFFQSDANAIIVTNDPADGQQLVKDQTGPRGTMLSTTGTPGQPPGAYMIYTGGTLPLPYLPDPLAAGIAVYLDPKGAAATRNYAVGASFEQVTPISFQILSGPDGSTPTATPGTGSAPFVVTLPRATILDVAYTSTMAASLLPLLAAWQMNGSATLNPADAASGVSPILTARRTMRLVHAVKQPLASALVASVTLTRNPGDTFVTIERASGTLNVHSRSTGEVEIGVEWTEPQDLLPSAPNPAVPRKAFAYRTSVEYGSDTVAFPVALNPGTCGSGGAPLARIDFGDTKARTVRFRCTSSTRYGEYYNPADMADPAHTTLVGGPSGPFAVPSSARGPKPEVAYVVPSFSWQDTNPTTHTRTGGSARIYLSRPWFATGDGELLAVVVANVANGSVDAGDAVRSFVSEWGFDPVYADTFATGSNVPFTTLTAARIITPGAGAPQAVVLAENGSTVLAVGHAVQYAGADRDLWFTDVQFDIGIAHTPLVRLAVARFQPNSISGLELSAIVRIDCLQLASNRTAAISRAGTALAVTVTGPSAPNLFGLNQSGSVPGAGHVVVATIDTRLASQGELDWTPVQVGGADLAVALTAAGSGPAGQTTWTASIPGVGTSNMTTLFRVRIEEFEQFLTADGVTPLGRPVYVDTFAITI